MSTTHPEPDAKTGVYRWRQTQKKRRTALTAGTEERKNEDEERKTECAVRMARSHQRDRIHRYSLGDAGQHDDDRLPRSPATTCLPSA